MNITGVLSLKDNYIWILYNKKKDCVIIDPGDTKLLINKIYSNKLYPIGIFLTHNHEDHTGGVYNICKIWPKIKIFGPKEITKKYNNYIVVSNNSINILGKKIFVILTPGHTMGHVSYYIKPYLFCGDVLFSGGCGRLFEGTAKDMYNSLNRINNLPEQTIICPGHEYSLNNMKFSYTLFPKDVYFSSYYRKIKNKTKKTRINFPTTLSKERKINIFFRIKEKKIKKFFHVKTNFLWDILALLRKKKDTF
ncbi:hydroxyacylglutathione hydrolase [Candidatus Tachikawaea gelatinosa]|uniref:Hydroxyacylglutathione hydrolase n=1 Tax=Candidatus Tachikawaea gelatinosa TaxID=1410383 RepID=A0A090ARE3_9ENTR|nr:hydroxyacylglutathione hydrolase [Candidatus Tachikawaea gelatinosa]BAP58335.1 hydroxyacylglutathione hydrolase [Candidatus Tachikawaea gelatinosa]